MAVNISSPKQTFGFLMPHLFAYGSLQLLEVFAAVTGQRTFGHPASIEGYARYRLKNLSYPGLVAQTGAVTDGILYPALDAGVWARLDRFEDKFYRRETLKVLAQGLGVMSAEVYVVPYDELEMIDRRPWSLEEFRQQDLYSFMRRCLG
jgi:gamma-glutamylcyclotransferase (GGCT)/AIG2-like uncharacterized protein YtfP